MKKYRVFLKVSNDPDQQQSIDFEAAYFRRSEGGVDFFDGQSEFVHSFKEYVYFTVIKPEND